MPPSPGTANLPLSEKPNEVVELARQALALRSVHVEHEGLCHGCLVMWARLAPHPCPQAEWAQRLLQRETPTV